MVACNGPTCKQAAPEGVMNEIATRPAGREAASCQEAGRAGRSRRRGRARRRPPRADLPPKRGGGMGRRLYSDQGIRSRWGGPMTNPMGGPAEADGRAGGRRVQVGGDMHTADWGGSLGHGGRGEGGGHTQVGGDSRIGRVRRAEAQAGPASGLPTYVSPPWPPSSRQPSWKFSYFLPLLAGCA